MKRHIGWVIRFGHKRGAGLYLGCNTKQDLSMVHTTDQQLFAALVGSETEPMQEGGCRAAADAWAKALGARVVRLVRSR